MCIFRLARAIRRAGRLQVAVAAAAAVAWTTIVVPAACAALARSLVVSPRAGQRLDGDTAKIVIRAGDQYGDLGVSLNGRQVGSKFAWDNRGRRVLLADDSYGLQPGRNVLRVRGRRGVSVSVRRATVPFTVTSRRPLVGAGRDQTVVVGMPVELDGLLSHAPGDSRLAGGVHWRVLQAPLGSRDHKIATPAPPATVRPSAQARDDAVLDNPLRPWFRPDVVGTYKLQLTVGTGANAEVSTVEYDAIPADPLVPLDTQVAPASSSTGVAQPGITVGATTYRMPYLGYENGKGVYDSSGPCCSAGQFYAMWQVVALDRTTLQPVYNRTYGYCQVPNGTNYDTWKYCRSPDNPQPGTPYLPIRVNPAEEIMQQAPGDGIPGALIIGRTLGTETNAGTPESYDAILDHVGFWPTAPTGPPRAIRTPTSFVGVPGMTWGEGNVSARADGELPGYLTDDQIYQYHFLSSVRPQFDTRSTSTCDASSCTIAQTFGGQEATATVPRGHGGYLVSGWDPVTLALRSSTFETIDADDDASANGTQHMLTTLEALQRDSSIISITSVRTPGMPTGNMLIGSPSASWDAITNLIASFGGTKNGFLQTASGPSSQYTLVGWAGAGEGGGYEAAGDDASARLRGALAPNDRSLLRPANVSSVGPPAEGINQMVVQPTGTDWKYPDASTGPGAAIQCIGAALKVGIDIRDDYTNLLTLAEATALQGEVTNLKRDQLFPVPDTGLTCHPTEADFQTAQAQLVEELGWVGQVRDYLKDLSTPEAAKGDIVWGQARTLGDELKKEIANEQSGKTVTADALAIVSSLLDLIAPGIGTTIQDAEKVTAAVEATAATFGLASSGIARAADGGPDVDPGVQADELAAHLELKARAATAAYTQIGNVLISDPNKLEVVGKNANCTPNVPGGCAPGMDQYAATGPEIANLTNVSLRALARTLYKTLVTQVWPIWDTGVTEDPSNPYDNFYCTGTSSPFRNAPPSAYASGLDSVSYGNPAKSHVYLMIRSGATWYYPSQPLMNRMFGPTGDTWDQGGLGMDPLTVMRDSANHFEPGSYSCSFDK